MFKIFTWFKVPVFVDYTWLFLLFIAVMNGQAAAPSLGVSPLFGAVYGAGALILVFACVLLHEFGHIYAAHKCGYSTHRVVLMIFGGCAQIDMEHMYRTPKHELITTIGGPLVTLLLLFASFGCFTLCIEHLPKDHFVTMVLGFLAYINAILFIFNAIPMFPMDGGRVLRSCLGFIFKPVFATKVAFIVCAILVPPVSYVLFFHMGSLLGAAVVWFILFMGWKEYKNVEMNEDKRNDPLTKYREILRKNGYG